MNRNAEVKNHQSDPNDEMSFDFDLTKKPVRMISRTDFFEKRFQKELLILHSGNTRLFISLKKEDVIKLAIVIREHFKRNLHAEFTEDGYFKLDDRFMPSRGTKIPEEEILKNYFSLLPL